MSASTERKNRLAAREAGTDKKLLAQQEEEKKQAKTKRKWTVGIIAVALLLVLILLLQSGLLYTHTSAVRVGDRSYSPAEVNYHYANQYYDFANQYGSYASLFGLDTSNGPFSLKKQDCPMLDGGSWRDYFLDAAYNEIAQTQGLVKVAQDKGLSLDEDELADVDEQVAMLDQYASQYGYSSANNYLASNYGNGVSVKIARQAALDSALASKAYDDYTESLTYTEDELEAEYQSFAGDRDLFDYVSYTVTAETVEVEAAEPAEGEEAPEPSYAPTEQTLLEAKATAEAIQTAYLDGSDIKDFTERLNAAIEAENDTGAATARSKVAGSSLGDLAEWMKDDSRRAGDVTVVADSAGTGYTVAVFLSREDNHYPTAKVRHILIKAEAAEDGSYTDEAKAAALSRAQEILDEYKAGDQTEEAFAALAEQYSEDQGSNTNGGLYEDIYQGQMVEAFDAFCFAGHQPGDTGIVYGESGSYAGYHVMYYVGEGDLYSSVLARSSLSSEAVSAWLEEITPEHVSGAWEWLAGK